MTLKKGETMVGIDNDGGRDNDGESVGRETDRQTEGETERYANSGS